MKLQAQVKTARLEVLADYKRKTEQPVFVAVLQAALENSGWLDVETAQRMLSGSVLNEAMWQNLLLRLTEQGYFEPQQSDQFHLTKLGTHAAETESFYRSLRGRLEITFIKPSIGWFPHWVVAIQEVESHRRSDENAATGRLPSFPTHQDLQLNNGTFRLEQIERNVHLLNTEDVTVDLTLSEQHLTVAVGDLRFVEPKWNRATVEQLWLRERYGKHYHDQTVWLPFQPDDLRFQRRVPIPEPRLEELTLRPTELPKVQFTARTLEDARQWQIARLRRTLTDYIFDEAEYQKHEAEARAPFEPFYPNLPAISRDAYRAELAQDRTANFYPLNKLDAPTILTY